ncbi:MAG: hypothetical protein AAF721_30495 [Myxococcota bacterium]
MEAYEFQCSKCDYRFTGAGQRDVLFAGPTWCITCETCKVLADVVVGDQPRCSASEDHAVREWVHPGPCPQCGATLTRSDHPIMHCH